MTDDNKRAAIGAELAEARHLRDAAERNAAQGDRETAANRLYLAAMHATKAVCLSEGVEPKSHRGLRRALSVRFVATGRLPDWTEQELGRLETERDLADYATGYRVSPERYAERSGALARLLAEVERFLSDGGWL